jgi:putative transposase
MPFNLVRYQQTGHLHFVTFSCYRRQQHLGMPAARELFERSLEKMRVRYDFFVTGYVVMPEHVHLLVSEPKKALLATAIQALKLSVAVQSNERPFWEKRYYDFNVFTDKKTTEKLSYMHRNPYTRGLIQERDGWAWSSRHHWWTGDIGTVEIESHWTAQRRGELDLHPSHISEARCGAPDSERV